MLHLILVRHGETEWNAQHRYQGQSDVPLSALGVQQAQLVAERLVDQEIDAIYASDLKRAWKTATAIAEKIGTPVVAEERLRELKFGILEGLTFDEAQAKYPEMIATWLEDTNQPPQGGESLIDLNKRIRSLLDDLQKKHDGQIVLLVAHGGSLGEMLRVVLSVASDRRIHFVMKNASLSEIMVDEEFVSLIKFNDTYHLKSLINK